MIEEQAEYNIEEIRRDKAVLRHYAAIQKASEDTIGCQKIYVDISGGIEEAFILDELIFFTLPKNESGRSSLRIWKNGVLWMAVRRTEWWDRKRLTARQSDSAIQNLLDLKLIYKEVFKFNSQPTVHIRLNVKEFFKRYMEILGKQNPPENEEDSIEKDISELYKMMGVLQNPNLQNGETPLQNGETELQNGEFLNSPHTTSTQPHRPLSIENAIAMNLPVTEEMSKLASLQNNAPRQFENALGFSKSLPWWNGKEWTAFAEWVCERYAENRLCFGEYNIWRNTPYTKGGMSNPRIRSKVTEFYDSWDMFMMSRSPKVYETPSQNKIKPQFDENGRLINA